MSVDTVRLPAPSADQGEEETVVLFAIGEAEYHVSAKPKMNVALKYLRAARSKGEDAAAAELLASLLGEEGFNALCDYDELTPEQFEAVTKIAQQHVLGALEASRGNGGRGSNR